MRKKELLKLRNLTATSKMMRMADGDQPRQKAEGYPGWIRYYDVYQYGRICAARSWAVC